MYTNNRKRSGIYRKLSFNDGLIITQTHCIQCSNSLNIYCGRADVLPPGPFPRDLTRTAASAPCAPMFCTPAGVCGKRGAVSDGHYQEY